MHDLLICFNCDKQIMSKPYKFGFDKEYAHLVFHYICARMTPKLRKELNKIKDRVYGKKNNVEQLTRSNAARDKKDLQG